MSYVPQHATPLDQVLVLPLNSSSPLVGAPTDELRRQMREIVNGSAPRGVALDLSGAGFLSRQLADTLVGVRRAADEMALEVVLVSGRPEIATLCRVRGLGRLFDHFPTREAALAHFAHRPAEDDSHAA